MTRRLLLSLPLTVFFACAADEAAPAQEAVIAIEDICDWWGPGDLTVVASDATMTPAGLAVLCEAPGGSSSSVVMVDTSTYARRDVYPMSSVKADSIAVADESTLVLGHTFGALHAVPVAGGAPTTIFQEARTHVHAPAAVDGWVYFVAGRHDGSRYVYALEKVALHGGPDQLPTSVVSLPHAFGFLIATHAGLHAFGIGDDTLTVGLIDIGAAAPTLQPIVSRAHVTYEPMGFRTAVADHVLWADYGGGSIQPARHVELRGVAASDTELACPLMHHGSFASGDHLVQVGWTSDSPCPGVTVTNRVDGTVRRGPHLDLGWQESYELVGLVDDRVMMFEGDTRFTNLVVATVVAE